MKKILDLGGQIKIGHSLGPLREEAGLYQLNYPPQAEESTSSDQLYLELWGNHRWEQSCFRWEARGSLLKEGLDWEEEGNLKEAYISSYYNSELRWEAGKKILSWGKAHSLNPMGFLTSPRDPFDDDSVPEGIVHLGAEYKREFAPGPDPLQAFSFTPLIFPVQGHINKTLGQPGHWNMAGKISLLFWNTDIDFVLLKGKSCPARYGLSFSRNLDTYLEIHGDFWMAPEYEKIFIDQSGQLFSTTYAAFGSLWGLCYEEGDKHQYIIEYYRSKEGFTPEEMLSYYQYLHQVADLYQATGDQTDIERLKVYTESYYSRPGLMQEYGYGKIIKREPLEIQHLTFSLAGLWNLQDKSHVLYSDLQYKLQPNLKARIEGTFWEGEPFTEFGEKANEWLVKISLAYLFDVSFYRLPRMNEPPPYPSMERPTSRFNNLR